MTPFAIIYLSLGLVTLFWPLATLLFKRNVLGAQWLLMIALTVMSFSVIVYSTFFNNFLKGEFLLVILFMVLSLATPMLTQVAVTALTHENGVPLKVRFLVVPSVALVVLMAASVAVGGVDMYRLWMRRGAEGLAGNFYGGSWRYNLVVAIHYYLYWVVLVAETAYLAVSSGKMLMRFHRRLKEYFTADRVQHANITRSYIAIIVCCVLVIVSYVLFPFNTFRPLAATLILCIVEGIALFMVGYYAFQMPFGAERLNARLIPRSHNNLAELSRQIAQHVEKEQACLSPDLTVFLLAQRLHTSQDDIIDAVYRMHGASFSDYVDSLRVEHSVSLLNAGGYNLENSDDLNRLAHQCGYLNATDFEHSFNKIMQMSVNQWLATGGG